MGRKDTCDTCKYRVAGYCHRFPPSVSFVTDEAGYARKEQSYPSVSSDIWCGEYKPNNKEHRRRSDAFALSLAEEMN